MTRRQYTEVEKAAVIGRALVVGPTQAAEEAGFPVTTVARWVRTPGTFDDIKEATKDEMAAALWRTVQMGTARLAAGLQDPSAKLGDVARAVEVAGRSHALLTGGATERVGTEETNGKTVEENRLIREHGWAFERYVRYVEGLDWDEWNELGARVDCAAALAIIAYTDDLAAEGRGPFNLRRAINPYGGEEVDAKVRPVIEPLLERGTTWYALLPVLLLAAGAKPPPRDVTPEDEA